MQALYILQKVTTRRRQNIPPVSNKAHNKPLYNNLNKISPKTTKSSVVYVLICQNYVFYSINLLFTKKLILLFLSDLLTVCILLTDSDNTSVYIRKR